MEIISKVIIVLQFSDAGCSTQTPSTKSEDLPASDLVKAMKSVQQKYFFLVLAVCACLSLFVPRSWAADLPPLVPVKAGDKLAMQMSLIRINDIAITSVSGEVGSDIFQHVKRESPFANMMMITLVNDRDGYIPSEAEWDRFNPAFVRGCAEKAIV